MHGCTDARMHGCTDARMHGCTDARMQEEESLPVVVVGAELIGIRLEVLIK